MGLFLLCAFFLLIFFGYGILIEPNLLKTEFFPIEVKPPITTLQDSEPVISPDLSIVQISDTHFSRFYGRKKFQKVLEQVQLIKPDIIVFTGDLVDNYRYWRSRDTAVLVGCLKKLQAPLGKYAILGNHDYKSNGEFSVSQLFQKGGFTLLENREQILDANNCSISITGIADARKGKPDYQIKPTPCDFNLLLLHEPDQITHVQLQNYQLIVAGHSHGGQIHLPFFRKKNKGSKLYTVGMHQLSKQTLFNINTGLGMTGIPMRFRVPPEITCYQITFSN